ncbi:MAG: NADPH-dependent glutamate synthase [Pseudomonadota bacterium]
MTDKKIDRFTRMPMREQKPDIRKHNFNEVPYGYSEEEAVCEATRCLQCKHAPCINGCPVHIKIPEFLKLIEEKKYSDAAQKIKEDNALPAVCGRVCPQEIQCELKCVLHKKGVPIAIGHLERFAADWQREHQQAPLERCVIKKNGKKVAIVGSGPSGLTVADELIRAGFDVTIFEALHVAGGVLMYGIPEFRLPKRIMQEEIHQLELLGVQIETNFVVGKTAALDDLLSDEYGFDAVYIGSGAGLPVFMGIPGENSVGVYSANEYLTRSNLMGAYKQNATTPISHGKQVVVVGGGNVAMDAARTALRLGAEQAIIVYRRSEVEMPARDEDVQYAKEEGVEFHCLCNPVAILSDAKGVVTGIRCIRMALEEPDESGRASPVPIKNSEFEMACDVVIIAIGNHPNPLIPQTAPDIDVSSRGTIIVDETTGRTSKKYVYAGGDIVTGSATVILAMGAGKIAAKSMKEDLL